MEIAVDPSRAIDAAIARLREADDVDWESDLAATFRARLALAERLLVGVRWRVDNAEAALTRMAAA